METTQKKEYIFTELGYFCESECQKIQQAMNGKTYMDFDVTYSNYAGNCTLIIKTDYEESEKEIKNFFLHCLITNLI